MKAKGPDQCRFDGCSNRRVIEPGEEITWSRRTGHKYHLACFEQLKINRLDNMPTEEDENAVSQTVKDRVIKRLIRHFSG